MLHMLNGPGLAVLCAVRAIEYALIGGAASIVVDALGGLQGLIQTATNLVGMLMP